MQIIKLVFIPITFCIFFFCETITYHYYTRNFRLIKLIYTYSDTANDTINWHKSSILPLQSNNMDVEAHTPPISLSTIHITYLGINISPKLS